MQAVTTMHDYLVCYYFNYVDESSDAEFEEQGRRNMEALLNRLKKDIFGGITIFMIV